ncbi:MAG: tRNA 2-thiocytidine biosynthesis protein TtcA [Oscillospiraceae bacterium]|nr:tRNA 2-thiocytidine biosynthesis protein TtcA [Oscillospiraceae bacterium]
MNQSFVNPTEEELSLVAAFRKPIWDKFQKAVRDYRLIEENDKIAVCISGGKDSMLLAVCMQRLQRYSRIPFQVVYLVMNPGYTEENIAQIQKNAERLKLPVEVFETAILHSVNQAEKHPCFLCSKLRRGALYQKAQSLGCNKIALGHHFDDVIETILMGMLYGSQIQTMMPKLFSENYENMQVIRPLYLIREQDIIQWSQAHALHFLRCACRVTQNADAPTGKRAEIKQLLQKLRAVNPAVDMNIFRSMENVNLKTLISYHIGEQRHHFLDDYAEGITNRGTRTGTGRKSSQNH